MQCNAKYLTSYSNVLYDGNCGRFFVTLNNGLWQWKCMETIEHCHVVRYAPKTLPLPFNGMERNRPFRSHLIIIILVTVHDPISICSRSIVFSVRFQSVKIYFHLTQSVLSRGSLTYVFAPVPYDFLVVLLYGTGHRFNTGSCSTSRLQMGRREALFEIHVNTCVVRA